MYLQQNVKSRSMLKGTTGNRYVYFITKRLIDIVLSGFLLLLLSPLIVFICYRSSQTDQASVFCRKIRIGKNNHPFTMWTFRTMTNPSKVIQALPKHPDQEITSSLALTRNQITVMTRMGLWLRKYSLENIPQLFNVFTGTMSLVGPVVRSKCKRNDQDSELKVKPGMTGYAQINSNKKEDNYYDLYYMKHLSHRFDWMILSRAIKQWISLFKSNQAN